MHTGTKLTLSGLALVAAAGAAFWMARTAQPSPGDVGRPAPASSAGGFARVPDQRSKDGRPFLDPATLEDGGLGIAIQFTGSIRDPHSLRELAEAVRYRGRLGRAVVSADLDGLHLQPDSPKDQVAHGSKLLRTFGLLAMYDGKFDEAGSSFDRALELGRTARLPARELAEMTAVRGIIALRLGEVSNCIACVGPSSCIFPIAPEAAHTQQAGSRAAIEHFTAYLDQIPGDLRVRWLLNLAYMTLGEYPEKVPAEFLIPLDTFRSKVEVGRFENVATTVGLAARGANQAGGSIFDDFTGDGLPDLLTTSLDADRGASFFVNKGDGTFADRSKGSGLEDQVYALNVTRADIDNDGDLDVLLLRGGWEGPMRLSLLKNKGDGTFEDVTIAAGMAEPIASESAAWGDFDNDGLVDVFVCGEYLPPSGEAVGKPDPRNRCRLYRNKGDGTFEDVATKAGVVNLRCAKGSGWGDYDGDGRLDLCVSNMSGPCRLYHNEGNGTFKDVAPTLDVLGAERSFACWFWDYDNDGKLDLYINDFSATLAEEVALAAGIRPERTTRPRLYRNLGSEGFRDVTHDVGLDRVLTPMGCNFGDIDNDGYLDLYLGTGGMSYEYLVPNRMFKNMGGTSFEDVTMSSNTGHLQKGHGISFADYDGDGDLDLFVEAGGAVPGDNAYNILFKNPGHGRHWLKVKLVGTKTNRAALGAKIRATVKGADGKSRSIHRTIGNNSSFGGNSLVELIGLGSDTRVSELEVSWPSGTKSQIFRDVAADQTLEITEGAESFKVLAGPRKD